MVSIGPVTSETLREHGLDPHVEAERHDVDGVIDALLADALVEARMVGGVELERPAMAEGPSPTPIVTFLSDYGYADEFVGVCHGVIADRCPRARVIDITHSIPRTTCARVRSCCAPRCPTCPLVSTWRSIDPGVGSERRAVALRTAAQERLLVGPDNGLLALAVERLGGAAEAIDLGAHAGAPGARVGDLSRARSVRPRRRCARRRAHRCRRSASRWSPPS